MVVYPVGIWLFCAALLFKASTAILAGKETPLTKAVAFLIREYDPTTFWCRRDARSALAASPRAPLHARASKSVARALTSAFLR